MKIDSKKLFSKILDAFLIWFRFNLIVTLPTAIVLTILIWIIWVWMVGDGSNAQEFAAGVILLPCFGAIPLLSIIIAAIVYRKETEKLVKIYLLDFVIPVGLIFICIISTLGYTIGNSIYCFSFTHKYKSNLNIQDITYTLVEPDEKVYEIEYKLDSKLEESVKMRSFALFDEANAKTNFYTEYSGLEQTVVINPGGNTITHTYKVYGNLENNYQAVVYLTLIDSCTDMIIKIHREKIN